MVVAQMAEQLLPIPEVHGSNTVIGNFYLLRTLSLLKRRKRGRECQIFINIRMMNINRSVTHCDHK